MRVFVLGLVAGVATTAALLHGRPAAAGDSPGLRETLRSTKLELASLNIQRVRELGKDFYRASLTLAPHAEPVLPGDLKKPTTDLRATVEALLPEDLALLDVQVYPSDYWDDKPQGWGSVGAREIPRNRKDWDGVVGPDADTPDDAQRVCWWYGRALWSRGIKTAEVADRRTFVGMAGWDFSAWEAPSNVLAKEHRTKGGVVPRRVEK